METTDLDLKRLAQLIKEIKIAMFTTVSDDGSMHTRPMLTQAIDSNNFDGTLWFFSKKGSHKNHCIENDQHVNLAFSRPDKHHYISISGRAIISNDRQKMDKMWNADLKLWFPEGLLDPELSLIGIKIEGAEIWDSPVTKAAQMVSVVKSALTGKPYETDHQAKHLDLNRH